MAKYVSLTRAAVSAAAVLLAAACSGGATLPPADGGVPLGSASSASVRVTIKVPKRTAAPHRGLHGPRYVSPSSLSASISFAPTKAGGTATVLDMNLGSNCTASSGSKTCTATMAIKPGSYLATVKTFDALNEGGSLLSYGDALPAKIVAGKVNVISLTLGGVPHSVSITGATAALRQGGPGLILYNSAAQLLIVTAFDADGNTIVGAGTPWVGSVTSGTGWSIQASPSPATPNELAVTPPNSNNATASLKITANYDAATCATAGVDCSTSIDIKNDVQILAVLTCNKGCFNGTAADEVRVWEYPYTGSPIATITNGISDPNAVAVAANGNIFVAACGTCEGLGSDNVKVYAPPYTGAPTATITSGIYSPAQLATDTAGDLFVDDCYSCNGGVGPDVVTEYSAGSLTTATTLTSPGGNVEGLTVDPAQDILVATCRNSCGYGAPADAVLKYASPYTTSPTSITNGVSFGNTAVMSFDTSGDLFVPDCNMCSGAASWDVTEYAPPYTSAPAHTISNSIDAPLSTAVDASGNLFVGNGPGGMTNIVHEYAPPGYATGTEVMTTYTSGSFDGFQAYELATDALGDLIGSDGDNVLTSAAPYSSITMISGSPAQCCSNFPFGLAP